MRVHPPVPRLRDEIEAAGWKVVDSGTHHRLEPLRPRDLIVDGRVLHGSSASVPSRLHEPPGADATVLVLVGPEASSEEVTRTLDSVHTRAAPGMQTVVVADAVRPEAEALVGERAPVSPR